MRYLIAFLMMLSGVSCVHKNIVVERAPSSSQKKNVIDLAKNQAKASFLTSIYEVLRGERHLTFAQIEETLSQYGSSVEQSEVEAKYLTESLQFFGITEPWQPFKKPAPPYFSVLGRYIDPQLDEDLPDGKPIWETVNRKLRLGQKLTAHESKFSNDLLKTIEYLPSVNAIVFRGMSLTKDDLQNFKNQKIISFSSFTSTSIQSQVARSFSGFDDPPRTDGRLSVILIAETNTGAAVSSYFPQNGNEFEVLIPPQTQFQFVDSVIDEASKRVYLFMKTLIRK